MKFGFGQPVSRVEDQKLIYGAGEYTDDILPGQTAHIVFLRSPFAHARLTHLDLTEARAALGSCWLLHRPIWMLIMLVMCNANIMSKTKMALRLQKPASRR